MSFQELIEKRRQLLSGESWASEITVLTDEANDFKLFLGAGRDAQNLEQLQRARITHILNVADDVPNFFEHSDQITLAYENLNVGDFGTDAGISRVFEKAARFVQEEVVASKGRVLVHCANGSNRSATIVIALVMMLKDLPLSNAWMSVCKERKVLPLKDNRKELLAYENAQRGQTTMRETAGTLIPM